MTERERVMGLLRALHEGSPWHGPSLRTALQGVTEADAQRRPLPGAHTIGELIVHLTAWMEEAVMRLDNRPAQEPDRGDWPEVPAWDAALAGLEKAYEALIRTVERFPENRLQEIAPDPRWPKPDGEVTFAGLLDGMLHHHAYHTGQISLLRRALAG